MRLGEKLVPRRAALRAIVAPLLVGMMSPAQPSVAFDNRLPPDELEIKYKTPRTPGPVPADIGPKSGGRLKPCIDGKPHCFSSSPEEFDELFNAENSEPVSWLVEPFRYDKPLTAAFQDVKTVIAAYPPGQRGIDGGGFKVVKESVTASSGYVYVQFESRRKGYIDDFEVLLSDGRAEVRTSSRLGYLDMGVNAKRFNYFADALGSVSGWKTAPLRSKGHEEYFGLNGVRDADV